MYNSTLPREVVLQISDIVESKLKKANIPYTRDGSKFVSQVASIQVVIQYQIEACEELVEKGVITEEMLIKEFEHLLGM